MEVAQLNQYEKVLIQRAKAFQVVTKMKTVAGKRLPPSHMVSKIRGSTIHLPLPLQETLKRLPTPDQPIPEHGELYILLRSIPSAKNVVTKYTVHFANLERLIHCTVKFNYQPMHLNWS